METPHVDVGQRGTIVNATQHAHAGSSRRPASEEHTHPISSLCVRRLHARASLDAAPDFALGKSTVTFKQQFVALESDETFFATPSSTVEACRNLLNIDIIATVAKLVHDHVTFQIGCNIVPLFSLESGGRSRSLFTFRCVYERCQSFLESDCFRASTK